MGFKGKYFCNEAGKILCTDVLKNGKKKMKKKNEGKGSQKGRKKTQKNRSK
jgi:hypothetical protein